MVKTVKEWIKTLSEITDQNMSITLTYWDRTDVIDCIADCIADYNATEEQIDRILEEFDDYDEKTWDTLRFAIDDILLERKTNEEQYYVH